jgi:hypothetical protein
LLREKDTLDKQTKNDLLELEDAKKEISRLEEMIKKTGKQNTGYKLLGELKSAKLRNAEERLSELEANSKIQTPRDVIRIVLRTFTQASETKLNIHLKKIIREGLEKLLAAEGILLGEDLAKTLLEALELFTSEISYQSKRTNETLASTRMKLHRTTDIVDKLQGSSYGQISVLLTKITWQILQKEVERLKLQAHQRKMKEAGSLNNSVSWDEPQIDPNELFPSEHMPFLSQPIFPDPKAYTPSVALQDVNMLENLSAGENAALVDKILTNKKLIDVLTRAIEGKLADSTPAYTHGPKKVYRINRNLVGKSVDSRDKSISVTYDDRLLSRDPSQNGECNTNRYNNSSSTRRPGDSSLPYGHYDAYPKEVPVTTTETFNPSNNLTIDIGSFGLSTDTATKKALITPVEGISTRSQRPAILRDAKTLSTKFNRIIKDDESISDGIYLLVDSELKKRKKKAKGPK